MRPRKEILGLLMRCGKTIDTRSARGAIHKRILSSAGDIRRLMGVRRVTRIELLGIVPLVAKGGHSRNSRRLRGRIVDAGVIMMEGILHRMLLLRLVLMLHRTLLIIIIRR